MSTREYVTKDSGQREEFSTGMRRDLQEGKTRYDLIIPKMMIVSMFQRWADLMTRGAIKYGERNWEKAGTEEELERYYASAFRHFMQWYTGETDEDHAAAVFFNIQGAEYVKERLNQKGDK
jgi:hypothetical protein